MTIAAALLTITVRVYDLYGLPQAERDVALQTAGSILAQAGIEAHFTECQRPLPDVCLSRLSPVRSCSASTPMRMRATRSSARRSSTRPAGST
jgi:hypothetical protein